SLFIMEWLELDEEPTILAILAQRPLLDFKRQAARKRRFPLGSQSLEIFRMKDSRTKVRRDHVVYGESGIIESRLVCIDRRAAWSLNHDCLWDGIGNPAHLALVFA